MRPLIRGCTIAGIQTIQFASAVEAVQSRHEGEPNVSDRSQALASQFKQATDNFLKSVENISEADWNRPVKDDARTVGVIAHHVAHGYDATVSVLQALLAGVEMQLTWDDIHGGNAMHAMENHDCTKHATI